MRPSRSPLRVSVALFGALLSLAIPRAARAEVAAVPAEAQGEVAPLVDRGDGSGTRAAAPTIDLYTVGPSADFPSRFGHSLLCAREAGKDAPENGRCWDYGVAGSEDIVAIGWNAVRNVPSFVPVTIYERKVVAFFEDQGRQIERQRIPLSADEASRLVTAMDEEVRDKRAFAYHPYWANCATKLRDHLDRATNGRLRKGPSQIPPGSLREYMEEGHSGRIGILSAMALYLGEGNDREPTPWEAMLLPSVLRDGVADRFSAPPEKLADRLAVILPTSRAVGRVLLFLLAFVLFVAARFAARKNRLRLGVAIVGASLGGLALTIELASALVKWPEIAHNWALLLFLPTDLALPFLKRRDLELYLKARMAIAALFVGLEVAGVVHQPMLPLAVLVALPMAGILSASKEAALAGRPGAAAVAPASLR